jgi:hypothetical protein
VYKLGKNWQTRAWHPVFKTVGSAPNAAMNHGLFSQKIFVICICPPGGPDLVNKLIFISISIRKNCIPMVFLSILQEQFLPCPVHPALFHILVVATSF